jgi:hypothetical protein
MCGSDNVLANQVIIDLEFKFVWNIGLVHYCEIYFRIVFFEDNFSFGGVELEVGICKFSKVHASGVVFAHGDETELLKYFVGFVYEDPVED